MRLFVACEIGEETRGAAAILLAQLRRRAERAAPAARIGWIPPERLHLTLRFIGQTDMQQAERMLQALRDPIRVAPFSIGWRGLGAFPPTGSPRVIWVGVATGVEELASLAHAVSGRLSALGVPPEGRPYRAHLTLARVREPAGLRAAALFEGIAVTLAATTVDAITLFDSRLSPKGPTYVALQQTRLQG